MVVRDGGTVRGKLILMAVSTTFVALLAASLAMLLFDLRAFQRYWTDDLMTQADIMARVTAPALTFNDEETARQNLAVLRVRPQILAAAIYTSDGTRFATYAAAPNTAIPVRPGACYFSFESRGALYDRMLQAQSAMIYAPSGINDLQLELIAVTS